MMARAKTVEIVPGSELARLIDEAGDAELVPVKDGQRFRVVREAKLQIDDELWSDYDPEAARRSIEYGASINSREETERWKQEIYRRREVGTRPLDWRL